MRELIPQPITFQRGQTFSFVLEVSDEAGLAFDLTGSTLHAMFREKVSDADPAKLYLLTGTGITHRNQTTDKGKADGVISFAQTATFDKQDYVYDLFLFKPSGERLPIIPVSRCTVFPSSTRVP